jgi:phosphate starvation-inducible protein PhoH and related proteins
MNVNMFRIKSSYTYAHTQSSYRKTRAVTCAAYIPSKASKIQARNDKQRHYVGLLDDKSAHIIIATGSAGTGKTMLATHVGVTKLLNGDVQKIVITRPAVSVDEAHGFLPGTLEKKMEPWIRPVFDTLSLHFPKNKIDSMMKEKIIEICPLAFMRGRTFEQSWIICDEAQNTTMHQMLMVLTRIGQGSKMVITGDPNQHDRGYSENGLIDLIQRVQYQDCGKSIQIVEFDEEDVERHEVIPLVLNLYKSF